MVALVGLAQVARAPALAVPGQAPAVLVLVQAPHQEAPARAGPVRAQVAQVLGQAPVLEAPARAPAELVPETQAVRALVALALDQAPARGLAAVRLSLDFRQLNLNLQSQMDHAHRVITNPVHGASRTLQRLTRMGGVLTGP